MVGTTFDPPDVRIQPGDTVTWRNTFSGMHNVHFDDGQFQQPAMPSTAWTTVSRTFDTEGTFRYVCDAHAAFGMTGTVIVGELSGETPLRGVEASSAFARPKSSTFSRPSFVILTLSGLRSR